MVFQVGLFHGKNSRKYCCCPAALTITLVCPLLYCRGLVMVVHDGETRFVVVCNMQFVTGPGHDTTIPPAPRLACNGGGAPDKACTSVAYAKVESWPVFTIPTQRTPSTVARLPEKTEDTGEPDAEL
jgi:hypothetical protein